MHLVWHRLQRFVASVFVAGLLAACASPSPTPLPYKPPVGATAGHWQGRLGVKILNPTPRSFNARFELDGDAQQGTLKLFTPLGTTLAQMRWAPGSATLTTTGEPQQFDSLVALSQATLGMDLPVLSLFDWLRGVSGTSGDWEVDLSALGDGKLGAKRRAPDLDAELKLILESD